MAKEYISIFLMALKTMLGSALVEFPVLISEYGFVFTVVMSIVSAFISLFGLIIYIELSKASGKRDDISTLSRKGSPIIRYFVGFMVTLKCIFVIIIYLGLIKQMLQKIMLSMNFSDSYNKYVMNALLFLIFPFMLMRDLSSLRYVSTLGVFTIVLMFVTTILRFFNFASSSQLNPIRWINREQPINTKCIGSFVFAFTCHQNIFAIHRKATRLTSTQLKLLLLFTLLTAAFIYTTYGLLNYILFGSEFKNGFLDALPNDYITMITRGLYSLSLLFSIPLHSNPCIYYGISTLSKKHQSSEKYRHMWFISAGLLFAILSVIIWVEPSFKNFLSFTGGVFSSSINMIFPGLFYCTSPLYRTRGVYDVISVALLVCGTSNVFFSVKNLLFQ